MPHQCLNVRVSKILSLVSNGRIRVNIVKHNEFQIEDINENILHYADKYFKKVIINTKIKFFNRENKASHYGVSFEPLEGYEDKRSYTEEGFDKIATCFFNVKGIKVPVYNPALAYALSTLTETQRTVLLQNIVLDIPLRLVADDLGLCLRGIEKHKHNAIEIIKKRMAEYEQQENSSARGRYHFGCNKRNF